MKRGTSAVFFAGGCVASSRVRCLSMISRVIVRALICFVRTVYPRSRCSFNLAALTFRPKPTGSMKRVSFNESLNVTVLFASFDFRFECFVCFKIGVVLCILFECFGRLAVCVPLSFPASLEALCLLWIFVAVVLSVLLAECCC